LRIPSSRRQEIETTLATFKTQSLDHETGSPKWSALNDEALQSITGTLFPK
tara:strand:+ start:1327 stop:1479 length:153 start_codon:yes stop_codon:yes gene_type:complete